tara:strand:+ start:299 stop:433 length:135 start_codon:yes stop_codon:yes gene_type:complete
MTPAVLTLLEDTLKTALKNASTMAEVTQALSALAAVQKAKEEEP